MMLDYVKVKTVECLPLVMESKRAMLARVKVKVVKYLITFSQFSPNLQAMKKFMPVRPSSSSSRSSENQLVAKPDLVDDEQVIVKKDSFGLINEGFALEIREKEGNKVRFGNQLVFTAPA